MINESSIKTTIRENVNHEKLRVKFGHHFQYTLEMMAKRISILNNTEPNFI